VYPNFILFFSLIPFLNSHLNLSRNVGVIMKVVTTLPRMNNFLFVW
jgi:hypothetical protein